MLEAVEPGTAGSTGPSPTATSERQRAPGARPARLGVLDGLRLVAALLVVCYHFIAQGDTAWQRDSRSLFGGADAATAYGWLGVQFFFVISGFVICMSAWGKPLGEFLVSRAVRLYPAYWFAILAITVAVWIAPLLQTRMISSEILINLTMFQHPVGVPGISAVFWTLWNELHFYLLFGLTVVWRGTTYRRVLAFCGLWTIASVFAAAAREPVISTLVDERYSPFFIGGVVLYLMYRFRPTLLLWGLLGISWALALVKSVTLTREAVTFVGYPLSWRPTAGIVTASFVAVGVATLVPRVARISNRWLTVAGAMTYPLYLLHLEIGWLLIRVLHRHLPVWPLTLGVIAVMLVFAYAVHRFIERPLAPRMRRLLLRALADVRDPAGAERYPARPVTADGADPQPEARPEPAERIR
ncbi:MAG: acyltransferase, partial [Dactylosporangium sp.]|nr:acyltransferase [Dactylosporangium sp.]NNJ62582.1 acyltransferase [Dactylosporangium sp.]